MKKANYLFLILLNFLSLQETFSQTGFQRLIGGPLFERAQTIFSTFDNGCLINGATTSYGIGNVDIMLIKTDNQGQILWSNTYGTAAYDNAEYAFETFDHNIVCAGRSELLTGSPTAAIIFKTDSAGNQVWTQALGGTGSTNDGFIQIIETSDLGYAAVGSSQSLSSGSSDIFLVKTDINGDTVFTRSFGTAEFEEGSAIIQLPDDGYLICGRQKTFVGGNAEADGLLLRTDAAGNLLWSKMYGDSLWEELTSVKRTPDGGFIATGSTLTYGAGDFDILLMKTDSSGDIQWTKTFGSTKTDAAYDIHVNGDSSFVLSGFSDGLGYGHARGDDSSNIFLMKTDYYGNLLWLEVYGDGLQDEGFHSNKANDGGYFVSGFTIDYQLGDSSQMLVIKTDSSGLSGCHENSSQPIDSMISMPYHPVVFNQLSGIPLNVLSLTKAPVVTVNNDACAFTLVQSPEEKVLHAYPNPFNNQLNFKFEEKLSSSSEIIISDMLGNEVLRSKMTGSEIAINTQGLSAGIFIATIFSEKGRKQLLLVKER